MIASQTAHQLVVQYLARMERNMNEFGSALPEHKTKPRVHLIISRVTEHDFGWVFFHTTKDLPEAPEAGQILGAHVAGQILAGNAPLIVDRNDGQLYVTGTAHPIEHYVDQYRKGIRTRA